MRRRVVQLLEDGLDGAAGARLGDLALLAEAMSVK
jgi:hypothetical protein